MYGLYGRQASGRPDDDIMASLLDPRHALTEDEDRPTEPLELDRDYCDALWRGVTTEYDALLATLAPDVDRSLAALAPVERALLVIGAWELTHRLDIPYRVVIDEAVELAKVYGGTDGHKFVNGVLDQVAARLRADEIRASARR